MLHLGREEDRTKISAKQAGWAWGRCVRIEERQGVLGPPEVHISLKEREEGTKVRHCF